MTMFLDSDKFERALYTEVPEKYLELQPTYFVDWVKRMNVFIGLPGSRTRRLLLVMSLQNDSRRRIRLAKWSRMR